MWFTCNPFFFHFATKNMEEQLKTLPVRKNNLQICPGDLLVYSRVLTHKASTYGGLIFKLISINCL